MKKMISLLISISLLLNFNHCFKYNLRTFAQNALEFKCVQYTITKVDMEEENDIYAVRV
ncbi:MAG: hypothetical protein ACRC2K_05130 [Clostridium sp.]